MAAKRSPTKVSGSEVAASTTSKRRASSTKSATSGQGKAAALAGGDRAVKVSVALPRGLWEEARAAVGDGSLSALVTAAVRRELAGRRTDAALAALDEIYGPIPPEVQAEVDAELAPFLARTR
jgi:hypothetical protein